MVEVEVQGVVSLSHEQLTGVNIKLIPTSPLLWVEFELLIDTSRIEAKPKNIQKTVDTSILICYFCWIFNKFCTTSTKSDKIFLIFFKSSLCEDGLNLLDNTKAGDFVDDTYSSRSAFQFFKSLCALLCYLSASSNMPPTFHNMDVSDRWPAWRDTKETHLKKKRLNE